MLRGSKVLQLIFCSGYLHATCILLWIVDDCEYPLSTRQHDHDLGLGLGLGHGRGLGHVLDHVLGLGLGLGHGRGRGRRL